MSARSLSPLAAAAILLAAGIAPRAGATPAPLEGRVLAPGGAPVAGALVTATHPGGAVSTTVVTDDAGAFRLPALDPGLYRIRAHRPRLESPSREIHLPAEGSLTLRLAPAADPLATLPSSTFLAALPEGEARRRILLDCTGCHQLSRDIVAPGGAPRAEDDWAFWIDRMLSFAGQGTGFPIIGGRDADETAAWLSRHLGEGTLPEPADAHPRGRGAAGVVVTEYELPLATDLPHDIALDSAGGVVVTGMMSHRLYRLTPASGSWDVVPIPVPTANPRAVEVGPDGRWWVALGFPKQVAVHDPAAGTWTAWSVDVYPHDVVLAPDGGVWVNGHFSVAPEVVKRLDPGTGEVRTYEVPADAMPWGGSAIPYGFRQGPEGELWMTELVGNRIVRIGPGGEVSGSWDMPTAHAGPRRLDVASDGTVWIPEYAAGRLARFDPASERFDEIAYPTPDALPYIARVDPVAGTVWVATGASNTIARWDPAERCWLEVPLPHLAALVRHIALDGATGDVWGAYAPSPSVRPAVFRVRTPERRGC